MLAEKKKADKEEVDLFLKQLEKATKVIANDLVLLDKIGRILENETTQIPFSENELLKIDTSLKKYGLFIRVPSVIKLIFKLPQ